MSIKIAGVLVGILFFLQNISAQSCVCKCGPTGLVGADDLCAKPPPTGPLVVRPKALIKPISLPLFGSSFKGPCYRRQAIVKPAVVPRPVYVQSDVKTETGINDNAQLASAMAAAAQILAGSSNYFSSTANLAAQSLSQAPAALLESGIPGVPSGIDVSSAYAQACAGVQPSAPADAVSLAIAFKQSQDSFNKKVAEDKLSYGFRKLPIEQPQQKRKLFKKLLPEENLYSLNGQIVELKPVSEQATSDSLSEEAQEDLLDLAISEEANNVHVARRPSLGELGYGPAKIPSATFVEIPSVPVVAVPAPAPGVVPCNDGFKSGTVEYKDFSNIEPLPANVDSTSCESAEEPVKHIPIPAPSCQCNYNGKLAGLVHSFTSSSKSSASASASSSSQKSNIILQKLCS